MESDEESANETLFMLSFQVFPLTNLTGWHLAYRFRKPGLFYNTSQLFQTRLDIHTCIIAHSELTLRIVSSLSEQVLSNGAVFT